MSHVPTVFIPVECETCGRTFQTPVHMGRIVHQECGQCRDDRPADEQALAERRERVRKRVALASILLLAAFFAAVLAAAFLV